MPAPLPTFEPDRFTAGETLAWRVALPEFPAPTFTLRYALQRPGAGLITITASADGGAHRVDVPSATSGAYPPGAYELIAYVDGPDTFQALSRRIVTILPSPLSALGNTHASRTLALIEAAIEGRVPNGLETTIIAGEEIQRIPVETLVKLQTTYKAKVAAEESQARATAGLGNGRTVYTRFRRPR